MANDGEILKAARSLEAASAASVKARIDHDTCDELREKLRREVTIKHAEENNARRRLLALLEVDEDKRAALLVQVPAAVE